MRARIFTIWLIAYVLGSMVAPFFELSPKLYMYLGLGLLVGSFSIYRMRYAYSIIFALGLMLISIASFQVREISLVHKNDVISAQKVAITGSVVGIPTTNEFGQTISLLMLTVNELPENAKLKIYAPAYPAFQQGQILRFETTVKPYGEKKWRLAKDGYIGEASLNEYRVVGNEVGPKAVILGALFGLRARFNDAISSSLPAAEGGLASGLILGEKARITPEVTRQLQISGTTHIIALSGYNITIILGLFVIFRRKLSRVANLLVPLIFIFAFVIMTGGSASLVRASIMGFMPLLAVYLGRESDGFIAILFSATLMIVVNPFLALYDVGFQLSFIALVGMIYLAPIIGHLLQHFPGEISRPLAETSGAQLAAIPILAFYFGSISLISPISNLVILALVPVGMLTAFMIGLAGLLWQGLANFVAIPGYVILHVINLLIGFFGSIPAASQSIKIENPVWIFLAYFLLFDIWLLANKVRRARPTD